MDITTIDPFKEPESVWGVADAYRKTFGESPYHEGHRCPVCRAHFPLSFEHAACPACREDGRTVILVDYWPVATVLNDFYKEMGRPGAECFVARRDAKVAGFAWGYKTRITKAFERELGAPGLVGTLRGTVFYLSEIAVLPNLQCRGIGKALAGAIFNGKGKIALRTLDGSQMYELVRGMGGTNILPISKGRCIMALDS